MSVTRPVRVMLFCVDGTYQRYLANLLHREFELCGIVVRKRVNPNRTLSVRLARYVREPLELYRYAWTSWKLPTYKHAARKSYKKSFADIASERPNLPDGCERLTVPDINAGEVQAFVRRHGPDVVCVNGTNLVREPLLSQGAALPLGMINLHSGLSPYTRGGNCNLFALLDRKPEWVGMTVHHIDPGIDSGDLILTARPRLHERDNYEDIEYKSFGLGIRMTAESVRRLAEGRADRIKQWNTGKLYLARTGYRYSPWKRLQVNRLLEAGLIHDYLLEKSKRDASVRLVGDWAVDTGTAAA